MAALNVDWWCRPLAGTTIEGALRAGTRYARRFGFAVVVPAAGRHHIQADHGRSAHAALNSELPR
nr:hypothetical protein [Stenotrophomonas pavanii]